MPGIGERVSENTIDNLFRNVTGQPSDEVSDWPYEGMVAVIEQGNLGHWRPLIAHLYDAPWGRTARQLEDYLDHAPERDVADFFDLMLSDAREQAEAREQREVVRRIQRYWENSGVSKTAFAKALGTSPSRFSTYLTGQVMPSATLLVRMERLSNQLRKEGQGIADSVEA